MAYDCEVGVIKISIIMAAYNSRDYVVETINSVLGQSYKNFQFIIIDDCSTDGTYDVLKKIEQSDARVRVYKNEKNIGVSETRNFGITQADGEWVAFIDSDDLWREDKLAKCVELIQKNKLASMIYSGAAFVDADGNSKNHIHQVPNKVSFKQLLKQNVIHCSTIMVKSDILKTMRFQRDALHEDFAFCLQFLQKNKYAYGINEPLITYRLRKNSRSANKLKAAKMTMKTYRAVGLNIFQMCYYFVFYTIRGIKKYSDIER